MSLFKMLLASYDFTHFCWPRLERYFHLSLPTTFENHLLVFSRLWIQPSLRKKLKKFWFRLYSKDSLVQDSYGELNNRKESDTTEATSQPQQTIKGSHVSGALKFRKAQCWMSPVLYGWQWPCFCCPTLDISGIVSRHPKGGWTLILTLGLNMCLSYFLEILKKI